MSYTPFAAAFLVPFIVAAGCGGGGSSSSSASASTGAGGASSSASSASSTTAGTGGSKPADAGPDAATPATSCTVATKGTSGVVLQGTVLALAAPLKGEVFIDGTGKIACVAASCAATTGYGAATVLSCPQAVISPGLVNAHDHTEYDTGAPVPHGTTRWDHRDGWRTGAGGEPKLMQPTSTTDPTLNAAAELRFVLGGATSVIGSGGVAGLLRNLAAYPDVALVEGLTGPTVFFDTFPLGDQNGTELTSGCAYPSPRAPSTAFYGGAAYAPHVSEGINAAAENEFACVSGSLGLLTAQTALIHGVGLNAKDVAAIAAAGAKLIWSPRSNVSLYGNTMPVTVVKAAGVTMALGTDWTASGSMNMLRELQCAESLSQGWFGGAFTAQELWTMATKNGAIAAKYDSQIGELKVGLVGDIAVFSGATADYQAVVSAGVEDVRLVLRGGKVLYGDADLVTALAPSCDALEVCGIARQVCMDAPGVTLAGVQAALAPVYPLFFCKGTDPTDEPTCVPYRDTYTAGETAADADGDGLAAAMDDCPGIFNPVRPMDGTTQADVDGDGVGDACDPKPLDATVK
jgi:cytosine/adenosine deaminase-related metal-dependent hydrolase